VSDVHCIIDAMIGKESGVGLLCPCTEGVPDVVLVRALFPWQSRSYALLYWPNVAALCSSAFHPCSFAPQTVYVDLQNQ
jgi:hypothetical protein